MAHFKCEYVHEEIFKYLSLTPRHSGAKLSINAEH